jgi:hypothetical protein
VNNFLEKTSETIEVKDTTEKIIIVTFDTNKTDKTLKVATKGKTSRKKSVGIKIWII